MSAQHPRLLARLGGLFDRRIRIEKQGVGLNSTGQQTGAFTSVPGFESIEAQRALISLGGEEVNLAGGTKVIVRYVWTLRGAFDVKVGYQLVELDADGQPTGAIHAIYVSDIDSLGITTLKTAQVKR